MAASFTSPWRRSSSSPHAVRKRRSSTKSGAGRLRRRIPGHVGGAAGLPLGRSRQRPLAARAHGCAISRPRPRRTPRMALMPIVELGVRRGLRHPHPSFRRLGLPPLDSIENEDWGRDYLLSPASGHACRGPCRGRPDHRRRPRDGRRVRVVGWRYCGPSGEASFPLLLATQDARRYPQARWPSQSELIWPMCCTRLGVG